MCETKIADGSNAAGALSYAAAGVDIDAADKLKRRLADTVSTGGFPHCVPINRVGAFASLVDIGLSEYRRPIFVLKSEEPGSKQLLSIQNGRHEWIARDLIHHLINDIIVMGAKPCAVLDTIICGKFEGGAIERLVNGMSKACADNGCVLVGGETSEQPGVLEAGRYVLQASILGVVDKDRIIDGSAIRETDVILALPSNGLHTNGYSLVRKLIETKPEILGEKPGGIDFLECILEPHASYANAVAELIHDCSGGLHGMAHITGGGMRDNLARIMRPAEEGAFAVIDLSAIRPHDVFGIIKDYADAGDDEMLRTFNCGVGMIAVVGAGYSGVIMQSLHNSGIGAYEIGRVEKGRVEKDVREVEFINNIAWRVLK